MPVLKAAPLERISEARVCPGRPHVRCSRAISSLLRSADPCIEPALPGDGVRRRVATSEIH